MWKNILLVLEYNGHYGKNKNTKIFFNLLRQETFIKISKKKKKDRNFQK